MYNIIYNDILSFLALNLEFEHSWSSGQANEQEQLISTYIVCLFIYETYVERTDLKK